MMNKTFSKFWEQKQLNSWNCTSSRLSAVEILFVLLSWKYVWYTSQLICAPVASRSFPRILINYIRLVMVSWDLHICNCDNYVLRIKFAKSFYVEHRSSQYTWGSGNRNQREMIIDYTMQVATRIWCLRAQSSCKYISVVWAGLSDARPSTSSFLHTVSVEGRWVLHQSGKRCIPVISICW